MAAIAVLLLGSNIALTIPRDNSMVSSSDVTACTVGNACDGIDAVEDLQETLAVIHEPVDAVPEFPGPEPGECYDSSYPGCADIHAVDFPQHEQLALLLDAGQSAAVNALASAGDSDQPGTAGPFTIHTSHATRYYPISGDSSSELWKELRGDANPLSELPGVGRKPLGEASFVYSYTYQPDQAASASHCQVKSGHINVEFETVLPRLENVYRKPDHLRRQWKKFQSVVVHHEVGHHRIYQRLINELPAAMNQVGAVPCDQLDSSIVAAIDRVIDAIELASYRYDAHVGTEKFNPPEL